MIANPGFHAHRHLGPISPPGRAPRQPTVGDRADLESSAGRTMAAARPRVLEVLAVFGCELATSTIALYVNLPGRNYRFMVGLLDAMVANGELASRDKRDCRSRHGVVRLYRPAAEADTAALHPPGFPLRSCLGDEPMKEAVAGSKLPRPRDSTATVEPGGARIENPLRHQGASRCQL